MTLHTLPWQHACTAWNYQGVGGRKKLGEGERKEKEGEEGGREEEREGGVGGEGGKGSSKQWIKNEDKEVGEKVRRDAGSIGNFLQSPILQCYSCLYMYKSYI